MYLQSMYVREILKLVHRYVVKKVICTPSVFRGRQDLKVSKKNGLFL